MLSENNSLIGEPRRRLFRSLETSAFLFLGFLSLLLLVLIYSPAMDLGHDGAEYYSLADALSRGMGYRHLFFPDRPVNQFCPVGLPLLTIPFCLFWPDNMVAPHAIQMGFFIFLAPLVCLCVTRKSNLLLGLLTGVFIATNLSLLNAAQEFITDLPFLVLTYAILYQLLDNRTFGRRGRVLLFFGVYTFTFMLRAAAIVFAPIACLVLLLRRRYFYALLALLVPICVKIAFATWISEQSYHSSTFGADYSSGTMQYIRQLHPHDSDLVAQLKTMMGNVVPYLKQIAEGLFCSSYLESRLTWGVNHTNAMAHRLYAFLTTAFYPLILLGLFRQIRRRNLVVELFFFAYLALILVYPWCTLRYLFPLLPLLFFYFLEGILLIWTLLTWKLKKNVYLKSLRFALLGLLLLPFSYYFRANYDMLGSELINFSRQKRAGELELYKPGENSYVAAANYLKTHFKRYEISVIPNWSPMLFGAMSAQCVVPIDFTNFTFEKLQSLMNEHKARYFIIRRFPEGRIDPAEAGPILPEMMKRMNMKMEFLERQKGYSTQLWELK